MNESVEVAGRTFPRGSKQRFDLELARLPTGTAESMPVAVIAGRRPGPRVWLSGAIHGDEVNGVEIVRRLVAMLDPRTMAGTVIATPIVNVFGFINESRYLPDGRDLNRSFPGSRRGSLAARLAAIYMRNIVDGSDVGLDFHTAAGHRANHPQVRADLEDDETHRLAIAFGAPFAIHAKVRDGSIRQAASERGCRVILYEAGQVQRFQEEAIRPGVAGTLRVLEALGMGSWDVDPPAPTVETHRTRWVRASRSGIAALHVELGQHVSKGDRIGTIGEALETRARAVRAHESGYVIAKNLDPLASAGDALVHIAVPGAPGRDEPAVRRRRR